MNDETVGVVQTLKTVYKVLGSWDFVLDCIEALEEAEKENTNSRELPGFGVVHSSRVPKVLDAVWDQVDILTDPDW